MKKEDDAVFGPISFDQLQEWAQTAQIAPMDKVSTDQTTWVKSPMIPELHMDFLVEVSPDQYYGPTTLGAVKEFLQAGEINENSRVTNCAENTEARVADILGFRTKQVEDDKPVRTTIRRSLQQRIRELEVALLEERRARENAEHLVERLERRLEKRS